MRDYNLEKEDNENRKYFYDFDYDVMHYYMIKEYNVFKKKGNVLELGSCEGLFTKRLAEDSTYTEIDCVEASNVAIDKAKKNQYSKEINFINSTFMELNLNGKKYKNIFLTHVLEHIDDRIGLLNKIESEWLDEDGRLFLVCPNAESASRQLAVAMGIVESTTSVTEGEKKHGHLVTYNMENLMKDVKKSKLSIVAQGGIFFKPLANFQWDEAIRQKIVSTEYLTACYELGKRYPELCSSIYCVCEKRSRSK